MMIGYARVSTDEQNLALQRDALRSAGCETIFEETASGADDDRKGLAAAVARCAAGDVLVAWKIDGLGRSTLDLVGLMEKLKGRGVAA
jgi:DNA invertase Pin-like site-specific DNA recombinase